MENQMTPKMPTPEQRPDLYDDFDGVERPAGAGTGVRTPDYIQKLLNARKAPADAAVPDAEKK